MVCSIFFKNGDFEIHSAHPLSSVEFHRRLRLEYKEVVNSEWILIMLDDATSTCAPCAQAGEPAQVEAGGGRGRGLFWVAFKS